jgi:type IV pilus assembly protein PilB
MDDSAQTSSTLPVNTPPTSGNDIPSDSVPQSNPSDISLAIKTNSGQTVSSLPSQVVPGAPNSKPTVLEPLNSALSPADVPVTIPEVTEEVPEVVMPSPADTSIPAPQEGQLPDEQPISVDPSASPDQATQSEQTPQADITPPEPPSALAPQSSSDHQAKTVADIMFEDGTLSQDQYDDVKVKSALTGENVDSILQKNNMVPEGKFAEARAKLLSIPFISLESLSFSPQAINFLPRAVVDRFQLIPFHYDEKSKTISIAMANPVDLEAISFVRQKTGFTVKSFASVPSEVKMAIDQQYRQELVGEVGAAVKETEQYTEHEKIIDSTQIGQIIKEAPIAKIVSTILEYAVSSRSSDVHIEPQEDRVRVRYRIDGILYDKLSLPKNVQEAVISRIKILSEMKIDEHRSPQDGRFTFKVGQDEVDLRISIIPTVTGEKIVMRLLRKSGGVPTLLELGIGSVALKSLEAAIAKPHGIILVCGPTGSGKTTTLYSVLTKLNTPKVNIMSLEDPVEYQMPGVNQVQINPGVGLTFASGLRAFLRQDPNIILVGEIRDQETTELAMQAALTGHLVFSTLHTSNASGALPRLLDLGAESFLLASTITAIVGQRIVRKICDDCKEEYAPTPQEVSEVKTVLGSLFTGQDADIKLYKGKGCVTCGDTGYSGRVGIYEVLPASEKISHMVLERADSETLEKEAVAEGMITMMQDGYLKVLQGVTTIEEVLRVAEE